MKTEQEIISELGEIPLCQCGCGNKINVNLNRRYSEYKKNGYPKFINGHNGRGIKNSQETIDKKAKSRKKYYQLHPEARPIGDKNPMFGMKGDKCPASKRIGNKNPNFGKVTPKETKEKQRYAILGNKNPRFGKHNTREANIKNSIAHTGENNSQWKGGLKISQTKYRQSKKGKLSRLKAQDYRNRHLGSELINNWFEGCNRHHINKNQIICIPKPLHKSYPHNHKKLESMIQINKIAFKYLTNDIKQI